MALEIDDDVKLAIQTLDNNPSVSSWTSLKKVHSALPRNDGSAGRAAKWQPLKDKLKARRAAQAASCAAIKQVLVKHPHLSRSQKEQLLPMKHKVAVQAQRPPKKESVGVPDAAIPDEALASFTCQTVLHMAYDCLLNDVAADLLAFGDLEKALRQQAKEVRQELGVTVRETEAILEFLLDRRHCKFHDLASPTTLAVLRKGEHLDPQSRARFILYQVCGCNSGDEQTMNELRDCALKCSQVGHCRREEIPALTKVLRGSRGGRKHVNPRM